MLNETYTLLKALESCGQTFESLPPTQLQEINKPGFILRLDENAKPISIRDFDPRTRKLWRLKLSNKCIFPEMSFSVPFFTPSDNDTEWAGQSQRGRSVSGCLSLLERAVREWPVAAVVKKKQQTVATTELIDALVKTPRKLLKHFAAASDEDSAFLRHIRMLAGLQLDTACAESLLRSIGQALIDGLRTGTLGDAKLVHQCIVGGNKGVKTLFWVDSHDPAFSSYTEMLPIITRVLRRCLDKGEGARPRHGRCALSGDADVSLVTTKFPAVKLPLFKEETVILTKNDVARCNYRYGICGTASYPVSSELAENLAKALGQLTSDQRRGKTWCGVPSGRFRTAQGKKRSKRDIFIAYLESMPELDAQTAAMLAGFEQDFPEPTGAADASFEAVTQTVFRAIESQRAPADASRHIRCMLIREVDKGRRQIVCAERFTAEDLWDAAKGWQDGARNIPAIRLPVRLANANTPHFRPPPTPFLTEVVALLQFQWLRNGTKQQECIGIDLGEALDVFVNRDKRAVTARRILALTIERCSPLLVEVGHFMHDRDRRTGTDLQPSDPQFRAAATCIPLLGILLHSSHIRKETYMNAIPYHLGRLLTAVDVLYREYSRLEREERKPSRLLGSSLVSAMADSPARTLSMLTDRLPLYVEWARKTNSKEALAGVSLCAQASAAISTAQSTPADQPLTDTERAQLLLGYLAPINQQ